MLIAVMSDSHDNIWNLRKAISIIGKEGADMIIHCGDFTAPFMLQDLEEAGIPVHGVFGNNDGDQYLLTKLFLTSLKNIVLHGLIGEVDAGGFPIAFTHQGMVGEGLASTAKYKMVCFGHSHVYLEKKVGNTILLNPGEIMGKDGNPGFCMVDTVTGSVRRISLAGTDII
jgi:putative phosphoesterase